MKALKLLGILLALTLGLVAIAALIAPIVVDGLKEELAGAVGRVIGEPVEVDGLDLTVAPPSLTVRKLAIGDPPLLRADELYLDVDIVGSLRSGRLRASISATKLDLDLAGSEDDGASEDESDPDSPRRAALPSVIAVAVDGLVVRLPDQREVVVEALSSQIEVSAAAAVALRLEAAAVELRGPRQTVVEKISAVARWDNGSLVIDALEARGPDLVLDAGPGELAESSGARPRLAPTAVEARGALGPLIDFFAGESGIGGTAVLDLDIVGALADPSIEGSISIEDPSIEELVATTLSAAVRRAHGHWKAEEVEVSWPWGQLDGALRLDESTLLLSGDIGWDLATLGWMSDGLDGWRATSDGAATLTVELDSGKFSAAADGWVGPDTAHAIPIDVSVEIDEGATVGSIGLAAEDSNRLRIGFELAEGGGLLGEVALSVEAIETVLQKLGYTGPLPVRGGINGSATLAGTTDEPTVGFRAATSGLRLVDGSEASIVADGTYSGGTVTLRDSVLRVGSGELAIRGQLAVGEDAGNDWTFHVADLELKPVLDSLYLSLGDPVPEIAGLSSGSGHLRGRWHSFEGEAELAVERAEVRGVALGRVDIDAESQDGAWRTLIVAKRDAVAVRDGAARVKIEARGVGVSLVSIGASIDEWPVRDLFGPEIDTVEGRLGFTANLEIARGVPEGRLGATLEGLRIDGRGFGISRIEATGQGGSWDVSGSLLDSNVSLEAQVSPGAGAPFESRISWRSTTVPLPLEGVDDVTVTSEGSVAANGLLAEPARMDAVLQVDSLLIESGERRLKSRDPLRVELRDLRLQLMPVMLEGLDSHLSFSGDWSSSGAYLLRAHGELGLTWVARVTDAVKDAKGVAEVELELRRGEQTEPQFAGRVTLADAGIQFQGVPPATGVKGTVELAGSDISTQKLSGQIGGGRFSLQGSVDVGTGPNLEWSFTDVSLAPLKRLDTVINGAGQLSGGWDRTLLEGKIDIAEMLYDRDLVVQDILPSFGRALRPPPERRDSRPPLLLDLQVRARDGLHVENNIAVVEARTDLAIGGSVRSPVPRGKVEIIDGSVQIRGRSFEVVNGVLTFEPAIPGQAYIDFLAESVIESSGIPYLVQVRITGTTDNYRVLLESDEGLSQTDIASLIAFGKTVSELQEGGADSGSSLDTLAALASGQIGNFLAGELEGSLPFDQVELRAGFSTATGEFEPMIRLGKTITPDLSAWIAQTFGVQPQTAIEVTYALTQDISALLRWESQTQSEEGAIGGELSQQFEFWGLPDWLWLGADD